MVAAFRAGMQALGYIEGQNLSSNIVGQQASTSAKRVCGRVDPFKVDVIVVDGGSGSEGGQGGDHGNPVVFALAADPVANGLVTSIARPGGKRHRPLDAVGYHWRESGWNCSRSSCQALLASLCSANPINPAQPALPQGS